MALDVTVGGGSSESYATVDELDDYLEVIYVDVAGAATLIDLDTALKEHRLRIAALMMNRMAWRGVKACRDQRLEFPRWWRTSDEYDFVREDEDYFIDFSDIEENIPTIPAEIKYVQMELAYQVVDHLMSLDPLAFPERTIKQFELGGSLAIEFFGGSENPALSKASLSSLDIVLAYASKWRKTITGGVV